jgi:hypothetical protein
LLQDSAIYSHKTDRYSDNGATQHQDTGGGAVTARNLFQSSLIRGVNR